MEWGKATILCKKVVTDEDYIELELSFSDVPPLRGKFYDFKSQIEKAYRTNPIFAWSNTIFFVGIVITIIGIPF